MKVLSKAIASICVLIAACSVLADGQTPQQQMQQMRDRINRYEASFQGNMVLVSIQNQKIVSVGGDRYLSATSLSVDSNEQFILEELYEDIVAIKSVSSNKYVRAGMGDGCLLAATSTNIGGWEQFRVIDLGNHKIALKSIQNGKYVRAGIGRGCQLAATSSRVDAWEIFVITNYTRYEQIMNMLSTIMGNMREAEQGVIRNLL